MAQRAIIHPSVPRETRGIENGRSARLRGMRRLKVDVFSPLAMTFFTGDAQAVTAGVTHCTELRLERKRRAVTLQTARHDESSEVDLTIRIADRKSTRLNSSHITISYAVFCLKKKKKKKQNRQRRKKKRKQQNHRQERTTKHESAPQQIKQDDKTRHYIKQRNDQYKRHTTQTR